MQVSKCETYVQVGDEKILLPGKSMLAFTNVPNRGTILLPRLVDWYEPIQNSQYAQVLDTLTPKYQVAGVTLCGRYGQILAVQLKMDGFNIGGLEEEEHKAFLLVMENRETGEKQYGGVYTRVVCENTVNAAMNEKGDRGLPNGTDAFEILQLRTQIEEKVLENRLGYIASMNHLFKTKVQEDKMDAILNKLFVDPKGTPKVQQMTNVASAMDIKPTDTVERKSIRSANLQRNAVDRNARHRTAIKEAYVQVCDEFPAIAGTEYAFFQAITGHVNHSPEYKSAQDKDTLNLLFGTKADTQRNAMALLLK